MGYAIQVAQLTKVYGTTRNKAPLRAVDGIDFAVQEGEVFGFLGPNGAGKTTTIRMLTGLSRPTSGHACVLDLDVIADSAHLKRRIGVVPEASNLYDELSALDNLVFSMQLYGVPRTERRPRAEALLERFRLGEKRDTPFAKLSHGMKRALTVAAALAHRPSLVFLDEPTTGLDVMSARNLRRMIAGLSQEGVTVFLTTHYLEEAERLCDRVALIVNGRIVALDTVDGLKAAAPERTILEVTLTDANGCVTTKRLDGSGDLAETIQSVLAQARAEGWRVQSVNTIRPTLEDVFVRLTGLGSEVMLAEKGGKRSGNAGR
jgi:ABC-2 type transport system ATP-binding protein